MSDAKREGHPEHIRDYELLEVLGEGGMGIVYRVRQTAPVEREAALKVLKPGMDSRKIVARFDQERQALAVMEHPSIAQVFDAGLTEDGRPFFVMELVRGQPITDFCDGNRLSLRDRVQLFRQVCHAVQHAHAKGMIHRDLKPSNVLVTDQSGAAVPKVIDFGIARAVAPDPDAGTRLTQDGHSVGTPAYMAPEQLLGELENVDTRSDVYALGVLLYELLAGTLPFEASSYRGAAVYGVLERDPPTPSSRLASLDTATELAHYRRGDLPAVRRELKGDLDWIVTRAMARERERRYQTVNGLALDLERYLAQEPVLARPPSARYRMGKFVRRNRGAVIAAGAALLLLVAGTISTTVGMLRARDAEATARASQAESEEVVSFLLDIFDLSDPNVGAGDITARQLLDSAMVNLDSSLEDQPETRARMLLTMGKVHRSLGLFQEAAGALERSEALMREAGNGPSLALADVLFEKAATQFDLGNYDRVDDPIQASLQMRRELAGPRSREYATSLNILAMNQEITGNYEAAEKTYREVMEIQSETAGRVSNPWAQAANNLGVLYQQTRRFELADSMFSQAAEVSMAVNGPDHPRVATALENLVVLADDRDQITDSTMALQGRILEIRERELGRRHPRFGRSLMNASMLQRRRGDLVGADTLVREAIDVLRAAIGPETDQVALAMEHLAAIHRERGEWAEAEELTREALRIYEAVRGEDHPSNAYTMGPLGYALQEQGEWEEAAYWYGRAAEMEERYRGRWAGVMELSRMQAGALRELGRIAEAEALEAKADTIEAELADGGGN